MCAKYSFNWNVFPKRNTREVTILNPHVAVTKFRKDKLAEKPQHSEKHTEVIKNDFLFFYS